MKYNYNSFMKLKYLLLFPVLFMMSGFFSCSKAEPRILYGFMSLIYYPGAEERYSFFILPEDDDGVENLDELYLYHDREGLRWLFTSEDWLKHEEDGKTWIGSRNIAMLDNLPMPRGLYRAVLVNKGGESTERNFTYDGPETPPYPFPELSISGEHYRIDSLYPVNNVISYDQQGNMVNTFPLPVLEGNINDLQLPGNVMTIAVWAEYPEYHISLLTEAAVIR